MNVLTAEPRFKWGNPADWRPSSPAAAAASANWPDWTDFSRSLASRANQDRVQLWCISWILSENRLERKQTFNWPSQTQSDLATLLFSICYCMCYTRLTTPHIPNGNACILYSAAAAARPPLLFRKRANQEIATMFLLMSSETLRKLLHSRVE